MNAWEERQLAGIERALGSDPALARVLGAPTTRERRRLVLRRHFYPTGYLACALTYMVAATSRDQLTTMAGALVVGLAVWLVLEVRSTGVAHFLAAGLRGFAGNAGSPGRGEP